MLHGSISQKTILNIILAAVRTLNLTLRFQVLTAVSMKPSGVLGHTVSEKQTDVSCLMPPSSGRRVPDDGGSRHLSKVGQLLPDDMAQYHRRLPCSCVRLSKVNMKMLSGSENHIPGLTEQGKRQDLKINSKYSSS
jgi:hypothetical protein